ncbi:hypothetical protein B0H11DRAFT_1887544 [Mycena galericulata]|nr:hypothetical protein B0H11DRAFT_1887544 [Mycena galericulata]
MNTSKSDSILLRSLVPVLPPELERQIFEICALSRPTLIPKFMLIAWRVKEWVEPLLYHTIVLINDEPPIDGYPHFIIEIMLSAIHSKPAAFFRDSVRNLFLYLVPEEKEILSICTRVENLWIAPVQKRPSDLSILEPSTLKHLYTNALYLFLDAPAVLFGQLTHLELTGPSGHDVDGLRSSLPRLPQLTHLCFYNDGFTPIFLPVLQHCPFLTVLISLDGSTLKASENERILAKDDRFVAMQTSSPWFVDWQVGVASGIDYWHRAERFIAKRRSGEIDPLLYVCP